MRTVQSVTWTRPQTADRIAEDSGRTKACEPSARGELCQPQIHLLEQLLELRLGASNTL